jgi:kumamolisin
MTKIFTPTYVLEASHKRVRTELEPRTGKRQVHGNTVLEASAFVPTKTDQLADFLAAMNERVADGDLFSGRITSKSRFARQFGATSGAIAKGVERLTQCNLQVVGSPSLYNGEIRVRGRKSDWNRLIPNLELYNINLGGTPFIYRDGAHEVAAQAGTFVGIHGLDNTPLAKPHFRKLVLGGGRGPSRPNADSLFNPLELRPIFNVPNTTGKGQTIGIACLGGWASVQDAVDYAKLVLKVKGKVNVQIIGIDGVKHKPDPEGADVETVLDFDGCLGAYDATIYVVVGPNTDTGFAHVIAKLIDLKCTVITISWGSARINWTAQGVAAMHTEFARAQAAGITTYAAAGDNLSPDSVDDGLVHVDYPSEDECVISMIGLNLSKDGSKAFIWNDGTSGSGGGVSDIIPQQAWEKFGRQVKCVNDGQIRHWCGGLAGPGDPATGVKIMMSKKTMGVGGTSADGPLYAYMTACTNEAMGGKTLGFFLPFVVKNGSGLLVPVTQGDNAPTGGKGYGGADLTLGMLNFGKLISALR